MKIAHLVSTFPPHIGGMGTVCSEEVKRLTGVNQVAVFTLKYPGVQYKDDSLDFAVTRIKPIIKIGDGGWVTGWTGRLRGFDVVHLHYPFYGALGSLITAKKMLGFKLVITYHMDPQGPGSRGILQRFYDSRYGAKIFALADRVIGVDFDYLKSSKFGRIIGKEKISFLPNGVDTHEFNRREISWSESKMPELAGKKVMLFVGNFLPVKNFEFLIRLLPRLRADAVLVAVGGGYAEEKLKDLVRGSKYENRIFFTGPAKSAAELAAYYSAADLVVIPSLSESFSLVAVEAMSCGAIVLANDIAGIRGRINSGVNGFLAPADDLNAWGEFTEKLFSLREDDKRIIRGRARERALQYDWSNHVFALNEIYRSVL